MIAHPHIAGACITLVMFIVAAWCLFSTWDEEEDGA